MARTWSDFNRWNEQDEKYLPSIGEGETMATQIVTATTKLVYKWFNDGDVFDNTGMLDGWWNDLSDYANWLAKYVPGADKILMRVYGCRNDEEYTELLYDLCEALLDMEDLKRWNEQPKQGSVYNCEGRYRFVEQEDECEYEEEEMW